MNAHTPGPWELAWEDGKYGVVGSTTEGKLVALVGNNPNDGRNDERKANAMLIAAAPELLAACQAVFDSGYSYLLPAVVRIQMGMAIEKAKGEASDQ